MLVVWVSRLWMVSGCFSVLVLLLGRVILRFVKVGRYLVIGFFSRKWFFL